VCKKVLKAGNQMRQHKQRYHAEKTLACQYCEAKFLHAHQLRDHEAVHQGIRNHKCSYCEKAFFKKANVKKLVKFLLN
jgi:KRAB domain-containing zinc finger protein